MRSGNVPSLVKDNSQSALMILISDILIVIVIYAIPSVSHLFALPVYMIEPFRIAVLISYMYTNRVNALILAFSIPIFSSLISGHPPIFKSFIISIELMALIISFKHASLKYGEFYGIIAAMIFSKIIYYFLKAFAIQLALVQAPLVTTGIGTQMLSALVTLLVFVAWKVMNEKNLSSLWK